MQLIVERIIVRLITKISKTNILRQLKIQYLKKIYTYNKIIIEIIISNTILSYRQELSIYR